MAKPVAATPVRLLAREPDTFAEIDIEPRSPAKSRETTPSTKPWSRGTPWRRQGDDEFFDSRETVDLQLGYDWRDSYAIALGAKNLTDADLREFQGVSTRTSQLESLGRSFWLGLRARFQGLGLN